MTQNQLSYLGLRETKRNNIVVAKETGRANRAREAQARSELDETSRHNRRSEEYQSDKLKQDYDLEDRKLTEQNRHNLITEAQTDRAQEEVGRHNVVTEQNQIYTSDNAAKAQIAAAERNAQASKYGAKTSADASKYGARQSASASRYAAATSAAASRYATDATNAIKAAERAMKKAENAKDRKNQKSMQEAKLENERALKEIDKLMQAEQLTVQQRNTIAKIQGEIRKAQVQGDYQAQISGWKQIQKMIGTGKVDTPTDINPW